MLKISIKHVSSLFKSQSEHKHGLNLMIQYWLCLREITYISYKFEVNILLVHRKLYICIL